MKCRICGKQIRVGTEFIGLGKECLCGKWKKW